MNTADTAIVVGVTTVGVSAVVFIGGTAAVLWRHIGVYTAVTVAAALLTVVGVCVTLIASIARDELSDDPTNTQP